ncbi:DNA repair protein RecO [Ramlibacter tataouinensis]|uniref:DNA repair protein RecO n=1 Tax=Ramlibacter tataouinensis (strain ATCC BAA-407 / DSM 14655 / LMG 21543 / TTB310) TaxID=365046 RepID=F5Y5Q8_RAMTT|nr:DNA repair protein RecO [Ramlibacter tataouinensis]AEG93942.1 Candidate DNA repair protein [Ramlibacter tataouinensis TTB310]
MATSSRRISDEPGFVLHRYDWSESSLILEVFTRHHGRVALVAKGAKRPSSNFRPVLLPLQPLRLAFGGDAEIRTLKGAEWVGGQVMPTGDALLSGYYLNELLLRLLARDDPHPGLFEAYASAVQVLSWEHGEALQPALRAFELLLLREIGLLPALDMQTLALAPLQPEGRYSLVPEGGLVEAAAGDGRASLSGAQWMGLERALRQPAPFGATIREAAAVIAGLKPQLRALLHYHCGVTTLRTRQLMMDLQAL